MAESTVGTVEDVNVSSIRQSAGTRGAENQGVAGMTGAARTVYAPVVMHRGCCMDRGTVLVAGIAGDV
jgi:hypothetical protein